MFNLFKSKSKENKIIDELCEITSGAVSFIESKRNLTKGGLFECYIFCAFIVYDRLNKTSHTKILSKYLTIIIPYFLKQNELKLSPDNLNTLLHFRIKEYHNFLYTVQLSKIGNQHDLYFNYLFNNLYVSPLKLNSNIENISIDDDLFISHLGATAHKVTGKHIEELLF